MLEDVDPIFSRGEGFTEVYGGGALFDELKYVLHAWGETLKGLFSDYCSAVEGGGKPQMEGVVCRTDQ